MMFDPFTFYAAAAERGSPRRPRRSRLVCARERRPSSGRDPREPSQRSAAFPHPAIKSFSCDREETLFSYHVQRCPRAGDIKLLNPNIRATRTAPAVRAIVALPSPP
eukprot:2740521-Prymnesium_polylepis.1